MPSQEYFNLYLDNCDFYQEEDEKVRVSYGLETRSRQGDITDALRFRVYDPLWMLSRQWQLGEFKGNDAGTAMSVNCRVRWRPIGPDGNQTPPDEVEPLEPLVEQIQRDITPIARVESAAYLTDLLFESDSLTDQQRYAVVRDLRFRFPLDLDEDDRTVTERSSIESEPVRAFTASRNKRLARFRTAYEGKSFDGYKLYQHLKESELLGIPKVIAGKYVDWFTKRYLPEATAGTWKTKSLGYEMQVSDSAGHYEADDYPGGRLSWYSVDLDHGSEGNQGARDGEVMALPTLATYPAAPNKRLWEFEDRKVFMGNATGMQAKGNVAFLQYATMYGNDWMLFPLQTPFAQSVEVKEIDVYDSFGVRSVIKTRAGKKEGKDWQMFTNAPKEGKAAKAAPDRFLFMPSFPKTLEGEPIEEVDLLRDEMANMVWGVESRIDDGCGSYLDAGQLAAEVGKYVDDAYEADVEKARLSVNIGQDGRARMTSDRKSDLKYTLMTSVPFNWIPFVPQHIKSEEKKEYEGFLGGREVVLRRGKMPAYYGGEYHPVRPLTSILKVHPTRNGGKEGEKPLFIDEEQVQGVGTQIVKNCQRARWIKGKTYTWMGYSKRVKYTQAQSGLTYDDLTEPVK